MEKRKKVLIIALIAIVSLVIFVIGFVVFSNKSDKMSENLFKEKNAGVESLKLKIKEIEYINNFSNVYLEVNNAGSTAVNLDVIKIIFVDKEGNAIAEMYSYDNGDLEPSKELTLSLSIDRDITASYDVKYELGSGNDE